MKKLTTEVLIIGAGPAGCTAAQMAAHHNLQTILVDRQKFPRDKTCGDGISLSSMVQLQNLGFDTKTILNNPKLIQSKNIYFYDQKDERIDLKNNLFFTFKRNDFDNLLWENLNQKINKIEQAEPVSIEKTDSGYHVIIENSGEKIEIETKYLVGADGYSSYVRRNLFPNLPIEKRVASRFYLKDENFDTDAYHFYFHEKVSPGYFWIFNVGKNEFNTGVYLPYNIASKELFELHNYYIQKYFERNIDKDNFYTWPIPNNFDFNSLASENAFLIGDAAGLCDKLIGHGIDAAILSGIVAINSLIFHSTKNTKNYPLQEIFRYNMTAYFKDSLSHSAEVYEKIFNDINKSNQHLKKYFNDVLH